MPDKRAAKPGPSSGASMGGNPRRFSFDWFSDSEDHLASVLAEADAASAAMGGNFPSPLPSPLLGPQARLPGPDRSLFDQAFAPVDPESLNFESDEDDLGEGLAHDVAQPPPAPYTSGAPGASLWNPDVESVLIDTIHPQDVPLAADLLSLLCVLAQRTRDISHRHAFATHDTFVDKPSRLSDNNTLAVPPPSPGMEARSVFPAQSPHVVEREVQAVCHMLLTAGHWLTTVDVSSVPLEAQHDLLALAASAHAAGLQRFPGAIIHEPSCPLSQEAVPVPSPLPSEGVPAPSLGSAAASGSRPKGNASSTPASRPRHKGQAAKC
jgi:hypothetical protein